VFRMIFDNTKQIAFQASGITTGTTRTITMIDADLNLDTDIVKTAGDTMTGALLMPTGTAALPSIASSGDPSTGINFAANIATVTSKGDEVVEFFNPTTSAANYWRIEGADTGQDPRIKMQGLSTDVGMVLETKGVGVLTLRTGNATAESFVQHGQLQTTNATKTNILQVDIVASESMSFRIMGHGRENATGDTYSAEVKGCIRNQGGTTALIGETFVMAWNDASASTWVIDAEADNTGNQLDIFVTGEAAKTIDWKIKAEFIFE